MIIRKTALFFVYMIFISLATLLEAQESSTVVELRGMVVDEATAQPIPNVTIKNLNTRISELSDSTGSFTLAVMPGDTVIFEAMTYNSDSYVVPDDFSGGPFGFIEVMRKDALYLKEVTVRPFPSQLQFEHAFLNVDPGNVTDKTIRLDVHLEEVTEDPTNMQQYILNYNRQFATYQLSGENEAPSNNFLHPERWVQFIRDWQEGRFSEEAVEKLNGFPPPIPEEE